MPTIYSSRSKVVQSLPQKKKLKKLKKITKRQKRIHRYKKIADGIKGKAGLSINPDGVSFIDKRDDEEILLVLRRHPITNFFWIMAFLIMISLISPAVRFGWLDFMSAGFQAICVYAWILLSLMVIWSGFLNWYFNINIISSERVIDIDFYELIYREVTDAELDKIQDVTHNMGGLLGILFNFGNIYIQTAGTKPEIEFLNVPRPAEVASVLRRLREEASHES